MYEKIGNTTVSPGPSNRGFDEVTREEPMNSVTLCPSRLPTTVNIYVSNHNNMARNIPNDIVDVIIAQAIHTAHFTQAARLCLVNKHAHSVYRESTNVARSIIKDIVIHKAECSDSFKVQIKVVQGKKIAYELTIDKILSIFENATDRHIMFTSHNPRVFYEAFEKIVNTPNIRDVRVKTRCNRRDNEKIMPCVTRFIKYITSRCTH